MKPNRQEYPDIVFSSDGVRGISGEWPFTSEGMICIGQALSAFILKGRNSDSRIFLGRDTRPSGKEYAETLKTCLFESGIKVIDLGIAPTPVVAYLSKKYTASLGVIISASHNPSSYNGIKLIDSRGLRLKTEDERALELSINSFSGLSNMRSLPLQKYSGESDSESFIDEYIEGQVRELISGNLHGTKLLIDCSNGAISRVAEKLLMKLGASVVTINSCITGKEAINENCGSEYVRKNPISFIQTVQTQNADYGFAFDGDGDRIVVVDKNGFFFDGDDLLYVLATLYLKEGKLRHNTIVTTKMANSGLAKSLKLDGVKVVMTANGDKNLEKVLWEKDFILGAEQVGNMIINDGVHAAADPLFAVALICSKLCSEQTTMAEHVNNFKKNPQVRATVSNAKKVSAYRIRQIVRESNVFASVGERLRILPWYSSTEPGLFNVMMEGDESIKFKVIAEQAYLFCQKVIKLSNHPSGQIDLLDLSTRKRL